MTDSTVSAHGFKWVNGDRGDAYILKESSYQCLFPPKNMTSLTRNDTWMDIGAHFGSFSIRISPHVRQVIAVEPFPGNADQLFANLKLNDVKNVMVLETAAIGGPNGLVSLALGHTFDYTHRVGHVRGRQEIGVAGTNINDLIRAYHPNKIKLDCEGSEYEIMEAIDLDTIDEIIMEWHFTLIPDPTWRKMNEMLEKLRHTGFNLRRYPVGPPTKRWTAIIWAVKR